MKLFASLVLVAALVAPAAANPRKVVVMPSDGPRADAKLRLKVDAALLKLVKTLPDTVTPGETSMADLTAALGCNPEAAACKDEVLTTLGVDEVVATTLVQKPQGFDVVVKRITRGGVTKEASTLITADKPEALDGLAPHFTGKAAPTGPVGPTAPIGPTGPATNPTNPTNPAITTNPTNPTTSEPTTSEPTTTEPTTVPTAPTVTDPAIVDKRTPVAGPRDDRRGGSRMTKIGMGVGGGMVLLGLLFWGSASDLGDQIQALPVKNKADVAELKDLEARADNAANAGNVFVIGGLIVGGVSTYYYLKHKKARSSQARILPTVVPGGAGLAFSWGAW